jgi:hypothetical protein
MGLFLLAGSDEIRINEMEIAGKIQTTMNWNSIIITLFLFFMVIAKLRWSQENNDSPVGISI